MKSSVRRYSAVELLITLGLLTVVAPFVDDLPHGEVIVSGLVALTLLAAVLAIGERRWILVVASYLGLQLMISRLVSHLHPELLSPAVTYISALAFSGFVLANLLRFVLRAPQVTTEVLCAGLATYLLLGLSWSAAYLLVAHCQPDAFSFNAVVVPSRTLQPYDAFYFSLLTLTTAGYGDITPVSRVARMLATLEAIVGVFYVAVLIARLVALYSAPPKSESR